jgi:O-antigen/teichoic acid export membrane protein
MKNNFNIFKQTSWSILTRILSSGISFISISILLKTLGINEFGIWITISALFASFSFVDLGLANGLRNALPKFEDDRVKSNNLIVQTFFITIIIALIAIIIFESFSFSNILVDFLKLKYKIVDLEIIIDILFYLLIITLCVKPAHAVIQAEHKSHLVSLLLLITQALSLIGYSIILILDVENPLFKVVLVYAITTIVINLSFCIYVIRSKIKDLNNISIYSNTVIDLLKSGLLFFVTAISYLSILQIINVLVIRNLGPSAAGEYGLYSKLFFAINQIAIAGFLPIWSAFASANEKNDFIWKKKTFLKIEKTFLIVLGFLFIVFMSGELIYEIWLGNGSFSYSYHLGALFSLLSLMIVINTGYAYILNGLNKLRLQIILNCVFVSLILLMNLLDYFNNFSNILIVLITGYALVNIFYRKKIKINL